VIQTKTICYIYATKTTLHDVEFSRKKTEVLIRSTNYITFLVWLISIR